MVDIKLHFTHDELELYQNTVKFQNIMTRVVQKFSFCIHTQKKQLYPKTTNKQIWKLSKVKFWSKPNMQNSAYKKPLNLEL